MNADKIIIHWISYLHVSEIRWPTAFPHHWSTCFKCICT